MTANEKVPLSSRKLAVMKLGRLILDDVGENR